MSFSDSQGRLTSATSQLRMCWETTRGAWRDRKAEEFEQTYLAELDASVTAAVRVMEELERLLLKVHADCD